MMTVDEVLKDYAKILKDRYERYPVRVADELKEDVKTGQVRELLFLTPERCLVGAEVEPDLFVVAPLTPHLRLCPKDGVAVKVKRKRDEKEFIWGVLPSYAYIRREVLRDFSIVLDELDKEDVKKVLEFVGSYDRSNLASYKRKFLKFVMHRYSKLMWASFIKHLQT